MSEPRTIYYDHARDPDEQPAFPRGEAGAVIVESGGRWISETEVQIGPNSHCALVHHGVADELTALPDARGRAGSGRDLLLAPGAAETAAHIFYEADRKTYGASYDFLALAQEIPEAIHYRIAIDNREYQQTLSQLQFLSTTAARHGRGLRIRL
ncbi:MAG: hypothetical protein VCC67_00875 [Myxococcota bacterium]